MKNIDNAAKGKNVRVAAMWCVMLGQVGMLERQEWECEGSCHQECRNGNARAAATRNSGMGMRGQLLLSILCVAWERNLSIGVSNYIYIRRKGDVYIYIFCRLFVSQNLSIVFKFIDILKIFNLLSSASIQMKFGNQI